MTGIQAYDGKTALDGDAVHGQEGPRADGRRRRPSMMEEQADFDGPLMDYKDKGNTVELVGKEQVEGADAYKLKVTLQERRRRVRLPRRRDLPRDQGRGKRMMRGTEVESESYDERLQGSRRHHVRRSRSRAGAQGQPGRASRRSRSRRSSSTCRRSDDACSTMPAGAKRRQAAQAPKAAAKAAARSPTAEAAADAAREAGDQDQQPAPTPRRRRRRSRQRRRRSPAGASHSTHDAGGATAGVVATM